MSKNSKEEDNKISQSALDGVICHKIFIDVLYQKISEDINEHILIKPGEEISNDNKNLSIEQTALKDVTADEVRISYLVQISNTTTNKYITYESGELARLFTEKLFIILNSQSGREDKKRSLISILKSIEDRDDLPNDLKEIAQKERSRIESISAKDFDAEISSKDSKLNQRFGLIIMCMTSSVSTIIATGITVVINRKAVIQKLKEYDFTPPLDIPDLSPPNSDTSEQNNPQSIKRPRNGDKSPSPPVKKREKIPSDNNEINGSGRVRLRRNASPKSSGIDKSPAKTTDVEMGALPSTNSPGVSSNSPVSSQGIFSESSADIVSSNLINNVFENIHTPKVNVTPNLPTPQVSIGDCDGCDPCDACFIATAVYGDYNAYQVVVLRNFRDTKLMPYFVGRLFVKKYYLFSPPIAKKLKDLPRTAKLIHHILDVLIKWLEY
jgi:hypothetical protein